VNGDAGLVHVPALRQDVTDATSQDQGVQLNESSPPSKLELFNSTHSSSCISSHKYMKCVKHLLSYLTQSADADVGSVTVACARGCPHTLRVPMTLATSMSNLLGVSMTF